MERKDWSPWRLGMKDGLARSGTVEDGDGSLEGLLTFEVVLVAWMSGLRVRRVRRTWFGDGWATLEGFSYDASRTGRQESIEARRSRVHQDTQGNMIQVSLRTEDDSPTRQ